MIAQLKFKNGYYYCSNCRMRQDHIFSSCFFCNYAFSNYTSVMTELFKEKENEEIKDLT